MKNAIGINKIGQSHIDNDINNQDFCLSFSGHNGEYKIVWDG